MAYVFGILRGSSRGAMEVDHNEVCLEQAVSPTGYHLCRLILSVLSWAEGPLDQSGSDSVLSRDTETCTRCGGTFGWPTAR